MTPHERIEEAHGLWELAVARLAAVSEASLQCNHGQLTSLIGDAVFAEREAFKNWQRVSKECGA